MSVIIKNFGNDTVCNTVEDFVRVVETKYLGKSVSVISKQKSGIDKITFIDILDSGALVRSNNYQQIFATDFF